MTDQQASMIAALEQALVDAKSGRLTAFAFAGTGNGEHVLAYSYDEACDNAWYWLLGAVDEVRAELRSTIPPATLLVIEGPVR